MLNEQNKQREKEINKQTQFNKVCFEILPIKIKNMFNCFWFEYHFLLFTEKLAAQTAWLYLSPPVQCLETVLQCTPHGEFLALFM